MIFLFLFHTSKHIRVYINMHICVYTCMCTHYINTCVSIYVCIIYAYTYMKYAHTHTHSQHPNVQNSFLEWTNLFKLCLEKNQIEIAYFSYAYMFRTHQLRYFHTEQPGGAGDIRDAMADFCRFRSKYIYIKITLRFIFTFS